MTLKVKYNAPVTLTFSLLATLLLLIDIISGRSVTAALFAVAGRGGFDPTSPDSFIGLIAHPLGHAGWAHLMGNLSLILLLGPNLEEKHRSLGLFLMMFITALITGTLNVLFFPAPLMGASGIVFMMILLSSFGRRGNGEIPLTFLLVLVLYLVKEIIGVFQDDNISQFAHIVGGICGSLFGFIAQRRG